MLLGEISALAKFVHNKAMVTPGARSSGVLERQVAPDRMAKVGLALILAAFVVACGGGGGGGGVVSSGGGTSPSANGLMPTAPTLGAVLQTKATALRPLRAGATWTYHGTDFTTFVDYDNIVTQQADAGGGVTEVESHSPGYITKLHAVDATGDIAFSATLPSPWGGDGIAVSALELRSPVRVGDQITILDRSYSDIGQDLDTDKVNDAMDLVVYRRVIGNEDIPLTNLKLVTAVRVDTTLIARARYSSGIAAKTVQVVTSTWYAPGIGPVRQATQSDTPVRPFSDDASIVLWDGVTEGVGYKFQDPVYPANAGTQAGQPMPRLSYPVAVADGVLALTDLVNTVQTVRLDKLGAVTAVHTYSPPPSTFYRPLAMLRLQAGVRVISLGNANNGLDMYSFNESGEWVNTGAPVNLPVDVTRPGSNLSGEVVAASLDNDSGFWLFWQRTYLIEGSSYGGEVVVRRFAADGTALSPETVVANYPFSDIRNLQLAVTPQGALMNWLVGANVGYRMAVVRNDGSFAQPDIAWPLAAEPMAVSDSTHAWQLWVDPATNYTAQGVALDANGSFLLGGMPGLGSLAVPAPIGTRMFSWRASSASDGRFFDLFLDSASPTETDCVFWPEAESDSVCLLFNEINAGTQALLPLAVQGIRIKVAVPRSVFRFGQMVVFPDRVLILGMNYTRLRTIVVWRR